MHIFPLQLHFALYPIIISSY